MSLTQQRIAYSFASWILFSAKALKQFSYLWRTWYRKNRVCKIYSLQVGIALRLLEFFLSNRVIHGKTAQNLQRVFDYCKGQKCVLMLDEIDCIGLSRGNDTGADGELGRTTIALMQALDSLVDGQIVIAATNRQDRLDKALLRRFQRHVQFKRYEQDEEIQMIKNTWKV